MTPSQTVDQYLQNHLEASLDELARLVEQPSIAAQNLGMEACARLVESSLAQHGFHTEILPSGGAPVVYAERPGRTQHTLLFYNHYDVQPPEPLELWDSPPFQATRRGDKVYGRGISDNKGHIASRLLAIDALLALEGELPCTVKFIIEGEEEVSSPHMDAFVHANIARLAADACIWETGGVDHLGVPKQILGMRGICYVELAVETARIDVHSGLGGSIFPNAAWRLVWALNSLKGPDGRVRIPGFYDAVRPPNDRDRALMTALPDMADEYRQRYGIQRFLDDLEGGLALNLAQAFEPTCTICGLTSGYQGAGSKTVLPARASAKVDFRLVPDQTPERVLEGLRAHLDANGFADVTINYLGGEPPGRTDPDHPFIHLVSATARRVYGKEPYLIPMIGGSGPNHAFIQHLGVPIAFAGISYPGTQAHAPNENIRLDLFLKGARHIVEILREFGRATW